MKLITGFVLFLPIFLFHCFLFPGKGKSDMSMAALLALLGGSAGSLLPSPGEPINLNGGTGPATGTVTDSNGDGVADGISTGNNGIPDIPLIDTNNDGQPDAVDVNGDGVADYYICYHSDGTITLTVGPNCSGNQVVVLPGTGYDEVGGPDNPILGDIENDITAPSSSINPGAGTFASAQSVTITCSDNVAPGNIAYTTDDSTPTFNPIHGKIGGPPKVTFTVGQGGNGIYKIKYLCRDLAGNLQTPVQTANFTIDDHVPNVTHTSLSSENLSNTSGAINSTSFNWSSNRDGTYSFRLGSTSCSDGSVLESGSVSDGASNPATINASDLSLGSNSIRICVVDGVSSQVGQKIITILRDDTAPSSSPSPTAGDYSSTQNVLLSCTDSGAGCDQIVFTTNGSDPTITGSTGAITNGTKYTTTIATPDSSVTQIKFIARDNAGNVSSIQTANYTVDSTVATITLNSPTTSLVSASSDATITWQSSKAGTYQFRMGGTDCSTGTALSNGSGNTNVSGSISAGGPDTTTTIRNSDFTVSDGANTIRICVSNLIGNFGSTTKTVTKDSTPPTVSSTTPTDLSTGVAPNPGTLTVVFAEDMKTDQTNPTLTTNIFAFDGVTPNSVPNTNGTTFTWIDSKTLRINLSWINFPENVKIEWILGTSNLKDLSGNSMTIFAGKKFTTTVRAKTRAVADTGLTTCFNTASTTQACADASWPRQDADFSNIPLSRNFVGPTLHSTFTDDATVKDNVTHLTWRNCTTGQSSGTGCGTGSVSTASWYNSINACASLNVANSGSGYAGITNWRLPTSDELDSLPDYSLNGGTTKFPTAFFPNVALTLYWSATAYLGPSTDRAYFINGSGLMGFGVKTGTNRSLCVSE